MAVAEASPIVLASDVADPVVGHEPLERMAGMLAHELRNPLASATTNLAVAMELSDSFDPRMPFMERAVSELDRIRDLVTSCLQLACSRRVDLRRVDVGVLVDEACDAFASETCSGSMAVRLRRDLPAGCAFVCDATLVARALENLLENAKRVLSDTGGEILVRLRQQGDVLELAVEDSGPGVPRALGERVFEPLVSGGRGSGLGLAFVRRVAEAHGGRATLGQSSLGGAAFVLRLGSRPAVQP